MSAAPAVPTRKLITSDIRAITARCLETGAINLGQGLSDLTVPSTVVEGAKEAIDDGRNAYSPPQGIPELRRAIAERQRRVTGLDADPDTEVTVTAGSAGAFSATVTALFRPGDQVIVFEPYYPYHVNQLLIAGIEPVVVPLAPPDFSLSEDALTTAFGPRVKGVVACTPANPSGKMLSREELGALCRFADHHNLVVVADEVYSEFRYDDNEHVSVATLPGAQARTVTISGASKNFHITGWRIGYVTAPPAMTAEIRTVNDLLCVCAPTPLQHGVAAGMRLPDSYFDELRRAYQDKRDRLCDGLAAAGLTPMVPQGCYFVLCEIDRSRYEHAAEAVDDLIDRIGVGAVPASSFYESPTGDTQLRFCFAKEDDVLAEAVGRLKAGRKDGPARPRQATEPLAT